MLDSALVDNVETTCTYSRLQIDCLLLLAVAASKFHIVNILLKQKENKNTFYEAL